MLGVFSAELLLLAGLARLSLTATRPENGQCTGEVCRWLGIPFAEPLGRFEASRPRGGLAVPGGGYGPACVQFYPVAGSSGMAQSEDCLRLNVWAPDSDRPLPVMVWIHGGSFLLGSGGASIYDGARLAAQGVVVVTINYRLGPLGFLQQEDGSGGANGIGDQLTALQWVQAHIAKFGGDPDLVTIFGESSGSVSVCTLMHMGAARGLFKRVIASSGVCYPSADPMLTAAEAKASRLTFMQRLGVDEEYLQTADPLDLANRSMAAFDMAADLEFGVGQPSRDGRILGRLPLESAPLPVDLLVGVTSWDFPEVATIPGTRTSFFREFGLERLIGGYGRDRDAVADACMRCQAERWAERTRRLGSHAFFFVYDCPHDMAMHFSDVVDVFGTASRSTGRVCPPERLINFTQRAWARFAATGDPGWPGVEDGKAMLLGEEPRLAPLPGAHCGAWAEAADRLGYAAVARACNRAFYGQGKPTRLFRAAAPALLLVAGTVALLLLRRCRKARALGLQELRQRLVP